MSLNIQEVYDIKLMKNIETKISSNYLLIEKIKIRKKIEYLNTLGFQIPNEFFYHFSCDFKLIIVNEDTKIIKCNYILSKFFNRLKIGLNNETKFLNNQNLIEALKFCISIEDPKSNFIILRDINGNLVFLNHQCEDYHFNWFDFILINNNFISIYDILCDLKKKDGSDIKIHIRNKIPSASSKKQDIHKEIYKELLNKIGNHEKMQKLEKEQIKKLREEFNSLKSENEETFQNPLNYNYSETDTLLNLQTKKHEYENKLKTKIQKKKDELNQKYKTYKQEDIKEILNQSGYKTKTTIKEKEEALKYIEKQKILKEEEKRLNQQYKTYEENDIRNILKKSEYTNKKTIEEKEEALRYIEEEKEKLKEELKEELNGLKKQSDKYYKSNNPKNPKNPNHYLFSNNNNIKTLKSKIKKSKDNIQNKEKSYLTNLRLELSELKRKYQISKNEYDEIINLYKKYEKYIHQIKKNKLPDLDLPLINISSFKEDNSEENIKASISEIKKLQSESERIYEQYKQILVDSVNNSELKQSFSIKKLTDSLLEYKNKKESLLKEYQELPHKEKVEIESMKSMTNEDIKTMIKIFKSQESKGKISELLKLISNLTYRDFLKRKEIIKGTENNSNIEKLNSILQEYSNIQSKSGTSEVLIKIINLLNTQILSLKFDFLQELINLLKNLYFLLKYNKEIIEQISQFIDLTDYLEIIIQYIFNNQLFEDLFNEIGIDGFGIFFGKEFIYSLKKIQSNTNESLIKDYNPFLIKILFFYYIFKFKKKEIISISKTIKKLKNDYAKKKYTKELEKITKIYIKEELNNMLNDDNYQKINISNSKSSLFKKKELNSLNFFIITEFQKSQEDIDNIIENLIEIIKPYNKIKKPLLQNYGTIFQEIDKAIIYIFDRIYTELNK